MKVRLRLFALYRDLVGKNELVVELPTGADVTSLRQQVERDFPRLQDQDPLVAVNGVYTTPNHKLAEGDEVALLPPFSGGQHGQPD